MQASIAATWQRHVTENRSALTIRTEAIGRGFERECYVHPENPDRLIKVNLTKRNKQSKREIKYLKKLKKRSLSDWSHLPEFYGTVSTSKGTGLVVEYIKDYTGQPSRSLDEYARKNGIEAYRKRLDDLKNYFIKNRVIFNYDMNPTNLLLRQKSPNESELVIIDGIGDVVFIPVLNIFKSHVEKKIRRRWKRFEKKLSGYRP